MRVAIVENTAVTHHGQVGVALHEVAALVDIWRPRLGQVIPEDFDGADAVVVFGGEQSALDDAAHPYLPHLARALRRASDEGKAVLGICLGSQLLARAFGAENRLGVAKEFGWCSVGLTAEGHADPVLGGMGDAFPIFQWHSDTFTLPPGAQHLASSPVAEVQAFRIGRATYGTQFHFEASRAVVADWNRRFPDLVEEQEAGWLFRHADHAGTRGVQADAAGMQIARAWVALARDRALG